MRNRITTLLLAITLSATSFVYAEVVSGIAAIVNDDIITILELNREYAIVLKEESKKGSIPPTVATKLRADLLASMIDRKLIQQKIRELNIIVTEEEVRQSIEEIKKQNKLSQEALVSALLAQGLTFDQYKAQMKEQLERLRLMSQEVKSKVNISERELREYYESNLALYNEEASYRARHIFFKIPKDATNSEIKKVMQKAASVSAEARSNTDFAALARKYSDDPGAAKDGGDLGLFKKGEMLPEIEKVVITMNQGEISDLVATSAGFHIIKLDEKSAARPKPFEAVKGQIDDLLYRKRSEERFNQWTEELRKGAAIDIKQ